MLRIHLFGASRFISDGTPLRRPSPNALAVLAYLTLHHDERITRSTLAFTLWPDEMEAAAFARLRRALFTLNEALPPVGVPYLRAGKQDIGWNVDSGAWVDVIAFRQFASDPLAVKDAVELYAGPLLPEVEEAWLAEPRERLARLHDTLLETAVEGERRAGDRLSAQRYAVARVAADPLNEDAVRAAMELHSENTDRAGALRVYRSFAKRLRDEIGAEPDPATTALFARIMSHSTPVDIQRRTNVPRSSTSFIGRDDDIRAIAAHFQSGTRLVTIMGPGGVGKSRLAKEAGLALQDVYRGGVWFVEVAHLVTPGRMLEDIARALGLDTTSASRVREAVEQALRSHRTLLVIDGCEHELPAVIEFAERVLQETPETCILATSRERMRLSAEATYSLTPLRLPEAVPAGAADALTFSAIDLFVKRARIVSGGLFEITDANAATVARVVARTAGIPLAVELAVPWLRMIGIEQLAQRLADRFAVLVADERVRPERHQTLDALIGWSYESLSDEMRAMFEALAVFPGSFPIEAAHAVGAPDVGAAAAFERLSGLVDKSLVESRAGEHRRFYMLDIVREYCLRRQTSDSRSAARERLTAHIVRLAEAMDRERLSGTPERIWMRALADERLSIDDVLHATLDEERDPLAGVRLATLLTRYFEVETYERNRHWFNRALAILGEERSELYVEAVIGREMYSRLERPTAERLTVLEEAVDYLRTLPSQRNLHGALGWLAWTRLRAGRQADAYAAAREATTVARVHGSAHEIAAALRTEAQTMPRADREGRLAVLKESIALLEPFESDRHSFGSRLYLLEVLSEHEPWGDDILALADETMRECERAEGIPKHLHALCRVYVAGCRLGFGHIDAGDDAARHALRIAEETGVDAHAAAALDCIAFVRAARADWGTAARLVGYSDAFTSRGRRLGLAVTRIVLARARALVTAALDAPTFAARCAEGAAWSSARAAEEGLQRTAATQPAS